MFPWKYFHINHLYKIIIDQNYFADLINCFKTLHCTSATSIFLQTLTNVISQVSGVSGLWSEVGGGRGLYLLIIFVAIHDPESALLVQRFQHGESCLSVDLESPRHRLLRIITIIKVGPRCDGISPTSLHYQPHKPPIYYFFKIIFYRFF